MKKFSVSMFLFFVTLAANVHAQTSSAVYAKSKSTHGKSKALPGDGIVLEKNTQNIDGCAELLDKHCKDLYKTAQKSGDPTSGNRDLKIGTQISPIRLGENEQGLDYSLVRFLKHRNDNKDKLPPNLREALEQKGYFSDLEKFLKEADMKPFSLKKYRKVQKAVTDLSTKYADAWTETVTKEVEKTYKDYSTKEDTTNEEDLFYSDVEERLSKESNENFWAGSPEWARVEKQFNEIQLNFVEYLKERTTLSKSVKEEWIKKVRSVKLVPPDGLNGSQCFSTFQNAYYRADHNTFTVCAGLFNAVDDMRFIIAHELGHSLDPSTQIHDQERSTELSRTIVDLKAEVCSNAPMTSCPKNFEKLRNPASFEKMLGQIKAPAGASDSFYQCLRYHKDLVPVKPEQIASYANQIDLVIRSEHSDDYDFLTHIKPETINSRGQKEHNIHYMNPCGKSKLKEDEVEIGSEDLLLFISAYLCSDKSESGPEGATPREQDAKEVSERITKGIYKKELEISGPFSNYKVMVENQHSELVGERFADALASGVYARWVKNAHANNVLDRRNQTLSALSFFCNRPSLQEAYPAEAQWEKAQSFEPHSEGRERILESLKKDLRDALACRQDFEREECSL